MVGRSIDEYAYAHARIRGRLGDMPDESIWQQMLNAGDLETTIESMSGSGLHYWVSDFPRHPSTQEIERQSLVSLLGIFLFISALLPQRWNDTGRWLLRLPHVLQLRAVQMSVMDKKQLLPGSPFLPVISLTSDQRYKALRESHYGLYLDEKTPPESCWAAQFEVSLPALDAAERHIIKRLTRLLQGHSHRIRSLVSPERVWIERTELFGALKALLAGDPFQVGTLLIYAVLESIQFERVRAVLLLKAYQWPGHLLGGLA